MLSFVVNLVVRAAYRWAVPAALRAVRQFPLLAAAAAAAGQGVGAWLVCECGPAGDWPMTALGGLLLAGYTALLGLVAVTWWNGTWGGVCDTISDVIE